MKTAIVFVCVFTLSIVVSLGQSQDSLLIELSVENQSLKDVLQEIDQKYPIDVYFLESDLGENRISGKFSGTLDEVLSKLLKDTDLGFSKYRQYAVVIGDRSSLNQNYDADFYKFLEKGFEEDELDFANLDKYEVGDSRQLSSSGVASVSGTIIDDSNDEGLIGASIYFIDTDFGVVTDINGEFSIDVPIGNYEVLIKSFGYENKSFRLSVYNNGNLPAISLLKEAKSLDEVVVEATAVDKNVTQTISGIESITPKSIEDLPSFLGEVDVIKSLVILPGVSTIGEGSSGFNVRGGSVDQNLVLLDEAFVFNSSHALGFFSAVNADMVKKATLYKGNIPAHYDGRLSSVLDIELKEGSFEKFSARGGIGTVSTRLSAEVPLVKNKTSLIIGGRMNYSDWMLKRVNVPSVQNSSVSFYDANVGLTHKFGEKMKINLNGYTSGDEVFFSTDFGYDYKTNFVQGALTNYFGENLTSNLSVVYSMYEGGFDQPGTTNAFRVENDISYFKVKEHLSYQLGTGEVSLGGTFIQYDLAPSSLFPASDQSVVSPMSVENEQARDFSIYADNSWDLGAGISFTAGLRYVVFQSLGPGTFFEYENNDIPEIENVLDSVSYASGEVIRTQTSLEPRFSLKVQVGPASSFKFGFSRTSQFLHHISNTASVAPVDVRQLSNTFIEPQKANSYSLGYFRNFAGNAWETSLDLYYRSIDNLLEYRDFAELLVNDHLETELLSGIGRAYGVEISVNKRQGRLTGRLSYTYSRSERRVQNENPDYQISRGDWYPSNFDKPHDVSLVSKYNLNRRHSFSLIFAYSTGRPTTAPVGSFFTQNVNNIPVFIDRNNVRIPDYHRLDVAYTIKPGFQRHKRFKTSWTFSIYNLYGRANAFSIYYSQSPVGALEATKFSMLASAFPSITLNVDFK